MPKRFQWRIVHCTLEKAGCEHAPALAFHAGLIDLYEEEGPRLAFVATFFGL